MNGETKVRVFVTMPIALRQKINKNIKAQPNTENQRMLKCVEVGYKQLTQQPLCKAATQPLGAVSP